MPGRTWIIAPDAKSLEWRWQKLVHAPEEQKEVLFHPHLVDGKPGDKHSKRIATTALAGYKISSKSVAAETGSCIPPVQYAFRSFDRQWIIPDSRVINRPNPELWEVRSSDQIYLTAPSDQSPTNGPALTFTAFIPDLHHYNGRGGRTFPLWADKEAKTPNVKPALLAFLSKRYSRSVTAEDLLAYIAAVAAHPAFTKRFQDDLSTPGLHIPLTNDEKLFNEATELGRKIIWLHSFGERMIDPDKGRPAQPPRLPSTKAPRIPAAGAISQEPSGMPKSIGYDPANRRLIVGAGYVQNVEPATWAYEVSGKQVLLQWFSYRKADRERPIIGDRRAPSLLGEIQPDHWLSEYTTELINVLNVLGWLVDLEPSQAELLDKICGGQLISGDELRNAGALEVPAKPKGGKKVTTGPDLFGHLHE